MKAKTKTNPLKHFNDVFDARVKTFSKGGDFNKKTDGFTTENVTSKYNDYVAPSTFVGASPAKKKGGIVKSKK